MAPGRTCLTLTLSLALTFALTAALTPAPAAAAGMELDSLSLRVRIGEKRVLGREQPESFRALDAMANYRLPWAPLGDAGSPWGARLLASAGVLRGAGKTALALSLMPALAWQSGGGRLQADIGAGLGFLSQYRYAQQDFGGNIQGALTFGLSLGVYRQYALGYRFVHYSDAGAYGPDTIGADFHMLEISRRF